ncbi:MAG: ABC transporter substrate-binding protein [Bacteroidota bacterium]
MKRNILGIIGLVFLIGCQSKQNRPQNHATVATEGIPDPFKTQVKYAQYFTIDVGENYKTIIVNNPWKKGDTLVSYVLYPKGTKEPIVAWAEYKVPVPIHKVVATSSPHIGFIGLIDELDKITGVAEDRYIYNPYVYERVRQGKIAQVGSLKNSNLEILLDLSPDLVMKTGVDNVRNEDTRLTEVGIPISYNVEWMETNMLARAEWIKFIAAFFNKDAEADTVFGNVEKEYLKALSLTSTVDSRPSIMTGNNFKGTWYMPGADSYLAKLILDAGGDYRYKDKKSTGSLPLSFEVVLDDLVDADYWIGPRATSLKELEMTDERYTLFKPFREGKVFTFNKRIRENGGNDYWESGMTRPDRILKDVIKIFHPDLLPDHQLYYYKQLQ